MLLSEEREVIFSIFLGGAGLQQQILAWSGCEVVWFWDLAIRYGSMRIRIQRIDQSSTKT
jgi:hypothetical protein